MVAGLMGGLIGGIAGGATVSIVINAVDQFSGTFKQAEMGATKMQNAAKIAGVAFAGLAIGAVAVGTASLKAAADFEITKKSFEVMLGSVEKGQQMLEDLAEFTKQTPFQLTELETSARQLLGMGIEANKLIPTMKSLGDIAAGLGVNFDRLALNFGQVKSQGRLMGTELRDFSRAGVPIIAELAKNLNVSEAAIKDLASQGKISFADVEEAFRTMTSEGGQFANLMAVQMDSAIGKISNMKDEITRLKREMGEELLPTFKDLVDLLVENKQGIVEVAKAFGIIFGGALKTASFLLTEFMKLADQMGNSFGSIARASALAAQGDFSGAAAEIKKGSARSKLIEQGFSPEDVMKYGGHFTAEEIRAARAEQGITTGTTTSSAMFGAGTMSGMATTETINTFTTNMSMSSDNIELFASSLKETEGGLDLTAEQLNELAGISMQLQDIEGKNIVELENMAKQSAQVALITSKLIDEDKNLLQSLIKVRNGLDNLLPHQSKIQTKYSGSGFTTYDSHSNSNVTYDPVTDRWIPNASAQIQARSVALKGPQNTVINYNTTDYSAEASRIAEG